MEQHNATRAPEPPFAARTIAALERDLAAARLQIEGLHNAARKLQRSHDRLLESLQSFVRDSSDPGTEALAAVHCGEQLRRMDWAALVMPDPEITAKDAEIGRLREALKQ